jgi:hypothetical protein
VKTIITRANNTLRNALKVDVTTAKARTSMLITAMPASTKLTAVTSGTCMPDQFIFASAYRFGPLKESVAGALRFPSSDEVMGKHLYGNAARLSKTLI